MTNLDRVLDNKDINFANKDLYSQGYSLSGTDVQMGELDNKEGWGPKNWCFQAVVLEKTPESPMESKEIKPVNVKGNQPWILLGGTDAEYVPLDMNSWLTGKDSDAGKRWRQKEKRATEDEMVGWYHQFVGDELWKTLGDGEGQGSLVDCSPWGYKE